MSNSRSILVQIPLLETYPIATSKFLNRFQHINNTSKSPIVDRHSYSMQVGSYTDKIESSQAVSVHPGREVSVQYSN